MTHVLPGHTVVDGPGDFSFESGDVHTVYNKTEAPWCVCCSRSCPRIAGPSLIPVEKR
jgi:hypothetical protein